ncbi:MAG: hypothetical protein K9K39_00740 [Desulfohalobiaceae bacterium]|nr:hypothetical protein [Desulfohalobiaceae bacterium]
MRKYEVPQDVGLAGEMCEVNYALNENGEYELVPSYGWEVKTVTLKQAWEEILQSVEDVLEKVKAGRLSPLAYHMVAHQMDEKLLAKYAGLSRWRVKRHLKPRGFRRLKPGILQRYAWVFELGQEELCHVPSSINFSFFANWK